MEKGKEFSDLDLVQVNIMQEKMSSTATIFLYFQAKIKV